MTSGEPTDEKRKWRWLIGLVVVPLVVLVLVYWCIDAFLGDMCGNKVLSESVSPDGRLKAVIFKRDCGATTAYSTQVSILNSSDALPNSGGNTFAMEEGELVVTWTGNRSLLLKHLGAEREYLSEQKVLVPHFPLWQSVEIQYNRKQD